MTLTTQTAAALLFAIVVYYAPILYQNIVNNMKISSIPTVGCSGIWTSYIGAHRYWTHARSIVAEGYRQYRGSLFKVSTMKRWIIVVCGPDKIDDIRRASDDFLSISEAKKDLLDLDASLGSDLLEDQVHVDVVKNPLTRNIGVRYPDVLDEIITAFNDYIPVKGDEWVKIRAFSTIMDIVCRAGNRMLVGLPLCRDPGFLDLCKTFAVDIVNSGRILFGSPPVIRPIAARFTKVPRTIERGMKYIEPLVKELVEQEAIHGKDWPGRPNDILTWLLDVSKGKQRSLKDITTRVFYINLVSLHTTTLTLTTALFDLATYTEYVQPLREEVETIIQREGWSKDAIGKMVKLDSFIKESMRLAFQSVFGMFRKVMKDFTFSDGTVIPAGNTLAIPVSFMHIDPDIYPNADTFDGFRFEKMCQKAGDKTKHSLVSIQPNYLLFGHGRDACPGRFFAASELKTMLAHILINYDVKFANRDGRPDPVWVGGSGAPDPTVELLFRKRV